MDPLTLGLLGAQALIGGAQFIGGLGKKREKVDTSIQPEYKQAEDIARNAAQSTSAAYGLARQSAAQEGASARAAALRSSSGFGGLMRAQQQIQRSQQSAIASLYQSEVREKAGELRSLFGAKMATASAKDRMQSLKNELAIRENAAKDQLISAGLQNVFGAISGGVAAKQNEDMMNLYQQMYGGSATGALPAGMTGANSSFFNTPGVRSSIALRPKSR
jgi:hypothetical protein